MDIPFPAHTKLDGPDFHTNLGMAALGCSRDQLFAQPMEDDFLTPPKYPYDSETFLYTVASIAATQGDAAVVGILATSDPIIEHRETERFWGDGQVDYYTLRLGIGARVYGQLGEERESIRDRIRALAHEVSTARDDRYVVSSVVLVPVVKSPDGWREAAVAWLKGEGINNQGRVRSDNIAARQYDGLLFRSEAEVNLYGALKPKGVYLAPLPVFLRGGSTYQRLEPDFVLLHKGIVMLVEIDGATVHRESPAEAHARIRGLQQAGVRVERVQASECATPEDAERCAGKLLDALNRYHELRA